MKQTVGASGTQILLPNEIALHLQELVDDAKTSLTMVTPYFSPWPQMQAHLERAVRRKVDVRLIVREEEVSKMHDALALCHEGGLEVRARKRLHAKLYVSDKAAILTSMNLVDASATASWEAGVQFDKSGAPEPYSHLLRQATDLIERSELVLSPKSSRPTRDASKSAVVTPPTKGSCLRCGDEIAFAPKKPLCPECYGSWKKYGNEDYEEKHCHGCGASHATSVAKPLCRPCWAASKAGVS